MPPATRRVHLVAWTAALAADRGQLLRRAGFTVDDTPLTPQVVRSAARVPDAFVIDLSRAPSRGRDAGLFLRQVAATRRVPLVFVDGERETVAVIRRILPDASYSTWPDAAAAVRRAIAHPPKTPVVPGVFAPFSGVPLARKLGITSASAVLLVHAPPGFERQLGRLPSGVRVRRGRRGEGDLTLWFCRTQKELEEGIGRMTPRARRGGLWILWPKQGRGPKRGRGAADINQVIVRRTGLAHGLVDFKIASVDANWSGLRFTLRKTR